MQLSLITAMAKNRVIGINNKLPWSLPADLLHFKRLTWGKTIIMGRSTFESIGRPLPGRTNIVLSRQAYQAPGCLVYHNIQEVLEHQKEEKEVFIIGGQNLYSQTLAYADRLYLTLIHHEFTGDTYFPEWNQDEWEVVEQEDFLPDAQNKYSYTFQSLRRCNCFA